MSEELYPGGSSTSILSDLRNDIDTLERLHSQFEAKANQATKDFVSHRIKDDIIRRRIAQSLNNGRTKEEIVRFELNAIRTVALGLISDAHFGIINDVIKIEKAYLKLIKDLNRAGLFAVTVPARSAKSLDDERIPLTDSFDAIPQPPQCESCTFEDWNSAISKWKGDIETLAGNATALAKTIVEWNKLRDDKLRLRFQTWGFVVTAAAFLVTGLIKNAYDLGWLGIIGIAPKDKQCSIRISIRNIPPAK